MAKRKKALGRPMEKGYPPKIDASPEEIAQAMFKLPSGHTGQCENGEDKVYRCAACEREVYYPETLYGDGRCEACHTAAVAQNT